MTTVGIVGSRDYPDEQAVRAYVRSLPPGTTVVSGGRTAKNWPGWVGRGVDVWAAEEAIACGLTLIECEPDRANGVPACFHIRNARIVGHVNAALYDDDDGWIAAFSKRPITPGTASAIRSAEKYAVPVLMEPDPCPAP